MAYNDYITLNSKQYKVVDSGPQSFQRVFDRQRVYNEGLTGLTIIQDFTVTDVDVREPHNWVMTLRVFISERPDDDWGLWSDLLAAYRLPYVEMTYFDGTSQWNVGFQNQIIPVPRVGANIEGHCYGIFFADVNLKEIYLAPVED